jgi:glycosyltransferase involved in cell wall biosynthesis
VRVVALVESPDHVCCRYRLAAFRSALADAGHSLTLTPLPRGWFGRATLGRGLESADAVILQRKLLPPRVVARLRRRVRRFLFDFDDAVWLRDSYSPKGFDDAKRANRFRATVAACDIVIAGNDYLAAEARRFTTRVSVIPTCVDVGKYPSKPTDDRPWAFGKPLQLVWVGSSSTLRGLERFKPTLSAIGRAVPGTRLKLVCDRFIDIPDLPVDRCVWNEATEAREIAATDVGIGWVPDDPWSRGKCGLKVLQYQAAGLSVVANAVGVQTDFVTNAGIVANTTEEWVGAIRRLTDPELRQRFGDTGRRRVEAEFSVEAGARRWVAALETLAARKAG